MRWRAMVVLAAILTASGVGAAQDSTDAWEAAIHEATYTPYAGQLPKLDAKVWSTFAAAKGVAADRVTYATAAGMLVPAVVYRPTAKVRGKLPGIVVVNGHGSDKFGWYAFYSGVMLAQAGAVVVTYDPIGEGERNAERKSFKSPSPHDVVPPGVNGDDWGRRLAGLMQVDLMQAVSYLRAQPEVDAKRIGVVGYSMGAFITGLAAAMDYYDHRMAAVVLSGGGTFDDGPGGYFDKNHNPCQGPPYRALLPALSVDGEPARGRILFYLAAGKPMLVMNGTDDTVMDMAHHDAAWFAGMKAATAKTFGVAPETLFTSVMYPGVSHRPSWVNRDGVEWLNKELHFAFWDTDAKIEAQGLTHVSVWAKANGVYIAPNYMREDREGGLEAVGQEVPALTRAQLTVLPEAAWERLKDRLTFEAWEAKTMAVERVEAAKSPGAAAVVH